MGVGSNPAPTVEEHLRAAPRKLAEACLTWCASGAGSSTERQGSAEADRVGACRLKWEEETRKIMDAWLRDNPTPKDSHNMVGGRSSSGSLGGAQGNMGKGGKKARGKGSQPLTPLEKCSKAMSRVLRHEAGTTTCPISEEGWVKWDQMLGHPLMRSFDESQALQALRGNDKDRFVSKPDTEGVWWIAAWSGHTLDGVTGPAVLVEPSEVPKVLAHGSYRRHSGSIQRQGILRGRRDIHLHDPDEHSEKWRKDIETKVVVNTKAAVKAGCRFKKTGNQVWLCEDPIPVSAIVEIAPWDGLKVGAAHRTPRLHHGTGEWAPSNATQQPLLVTEEVAQVAREIAVNMPTAEGTLEVGVEEGTLHAGPEEGPETRFASGDSSECDWSGSDSPSVECVQAHAASSSDVKVEPAEDSKDEEMKVEDPAHTEASHQVGGPASSAGIPAKGEIEEVGEKVVVEEEPVRKRKPIKLGSAHLHILRAVADADASNWESLQAAIGEAEGSGRAKVELVDRLSQLAEARLASKTAALQRAEEHADHAQRVAEAENKYKASLDAEMARLERYNPVGPRTNVPLISKERLEREIASGRPIWQARREHRARERAAKKRLEDNANARRNLSANQASEGPLFDTDPQEGGQALDDEMARRARAELKEFRTLLKTEASSAKTGKSRPPDSDRRRKLKKQRRKEKKRNKKDDAELTVITLSHTCCVLKEDTTIPLACKDRAEPKVPRRVSRPELLG